MHCAGVAMAVTSRRFGLLPFNNRPSELLLALVVHVHHVDVHACNTLTERSELGTDNRIVAAYRIHIRI